MLKFASEYLDNALGLGEVLASEPLSPCVHSLPRHMWWGPSFCKHRKLRHPHHGCAAEVTSAIWPLMYRPPREIHAEGRPASVLATNQGTEGHSLLPTQRQSPTQPRQDCWTWGPSVVTMAIFKHPPLFLIKTFLASISLKITLEQVICVFVFLHHGWL